MGTVALTITLQNRSKVFYPGQVIRGQVTFINESHIKVKGLTVTIYGEGEVYWTESEVRSDTVSPHRNTSASQSPVRRHVQKEYKNHETYLCEEIVLFGQRKEEGGTDIVIPPGIQTYQFEFQLPVVGLPSSFSASAFGFVKYSIEARLKRPLFRYDKAEGEFYVNGILDLNFMPNVLQPFSANDRVDFGYLCCDEGYMTMDLSLNKIGFLPGQRIEFEASIANFSMNEAKNFKVELVQIMEFKTFDRRKKLQNIVTDVPYTFTVPGGGFERWTDSFALSSGLLPTNLAGCRIIQVSYVLLMSAATSTRNLFVDLPIVIGTEPVPVLSPQIHSSNASASNKLLTRSSNCDHEKIENAILLKTECNDTEGKRGSFKKLSKEYDPSLNPFSETESVDDLIVLASETNSIASTSTTDNNIL